MTAKFWVGGAGTWDNSTTTPWSLSSGGAGGAAVPGASDTITFDAASGGGTVTVAAAISGLTFVSITMGAFTGTLDFSVNNPSITLTTFSANGSGTRTLKLGSGTFTVNGVNGTVWDFGVVTNLTFNAGTSTVAISASQNNARTIVMGAAQSYNIFTIANSGQSFQNVFNTAGSTVATLNLTPSLFLSPTGNLTITNALNITGTAFNAVVVLLPTGSVPTWTLSGGGTFAWTAIGNMTFTGSPTATNSFNLGNNTGITITGPSGGGGGSGIIGS